MRMRHFSLLAAAVATLAITSPAWAQGGPVTGVEPSDSGVVVEFFGGLQTISAGLEPGNEPGEEEQPGLCAEGVIHSSCTPADEAAEDPGPPLPLP
jgi:hypothetical protein